MKMHLIRKDLWEIITGAEIMDNYSSDAKQRKFKNVEIKPLLLLSGYTGKIADLYLFI